MQELYIKLDFDKIETSNIDDLKKFFAKYIILSTNDIAQSIGLCANSVRILKKRCGLGGKPRKPPSNPVRKITLDAAPGDWGNIDWMSENYSKYGISCLARSTNRSFDQTRKMLVRLGIDIVPRKHKHNNREWLMRHYINGNLSIPKCAKLAKVCNDTIVTWLNHHKIPTRSNNATVMV